MNNRIFVKGLAITMVLIAVNVNANAQWFLGGEAGLSLELKRHKLRYVKLAPKVKPLFITSEVMKAKIIHFSNQQITKNNAIRTIYLQSSAADAVAGGQCVGVAHFQ
jgi:N-acetylglutamate synthase/N-acetylornithine aminotransferase